MKELTKEEIKEIAEQLDCGFLCYLNKETGKILFVPDEMRFSDIDEEAWADEFKELEENPLDYAEIEPMRSRDSFEVMADFARELPDSEPLKERLFKALNSGKPFWGFKYEIDDSDYREAWFKFKDERMREWVVERFEEIK